MANFKAQCLLCRLRRCFLSSRQPVFIFPKREEFHLNENVCRLTQGGFGKFFFFSLLYLGRGEKRKKPLNHIFSSKSAKKNPSFSFQVHAYCNVHENAFFRPVPSSKRHLNFKFIVINIISFIIFFADKNVLPHFTMVACCAGIL